MFYVGDGALVPNVAGSGFTAWFRYSYMDQNQNWEGSHSGPASDNSDKQLQTSFFTFGGDYMINRHWTAMAELPIYDRAVTSIDDGTVFGAAGSI